MTREEATWYRLEMQCIRTLMSMDYASVNALDASYASPGASPKFGGTVTAPANAIAVGAIGNAFAKGAASDGFPTAAEVIPVYSSADYIERDGAPASATSRVQRIACLHAAEATR